MQTSFATILLLSTPVAVSDTEKEPKQGKLSDVAPLVGDWEGRGELPGGQSFLVPDLTYEWMLGKRAIRFHSTTNLPDGSKLQERFGMIFSDPSDDKVKMWVTDSSGGNIQATLSGVVDSELAWEADAVLPDGRRVPFSFTISIEGKAKHFVRRGDATFEMKRRDESTETDTTARKAEP
jgi:hypothetical protein